MTQRLGSDAAVAVFPRGQGVAERLSAAVRSREIAKVAATHGRAHTTIVVGVFNGHLVRTHPEIASDTVTQAWTMFRFVPWANETQIANTNVGSEAQV